MKELDNIARARRAPKELNAPTFTEVEETPKHSFSPTVPTPPTPLPLPATYSLNEAQPHDTDAFSRKSVSVQEVEVVNPPEGGVASTDGRLKVVSVSVQPTSTPDTFESTT